MLVTAHTASNGDSVAANMGVENDAIKALEDKIHHKHEDVTLHISRHIMHRINNIVEWEVMILSALYDFV